MEMEKMWALAYVSNERKQLRSFPRVAMNLSVMNGKGLKGHLLLMHLINLCWKPEYRLHSDGTGVLPLLIVELAQHLIGQGRPGS